MRTTRRLPAALLVLALHLVLLAALLRVGGVLPARAPRPEALRWLPLRPLPVAAPSRVAMPARDTRAAAPASARPLVQPALELEAEASPSVAGGASPAAAHSATPPLELRPAPDGPRRRQAMAEPSLAERLRTDPRSNSPRLSLEERFAVAMGTPCFVDELDAEGRPQRHEGRWQGSPDAATQISQGVGQTLGVGGAAPARLGYRCVRAR